MTAGEVQISVRSLVEYVHRSGSIESGFRTSTTLTEGTRIHQAVQKTYADGDQKEVHVRRTVEFEDLQFVLEGRCDGLLVRDGGLVVDEIKSTSGELARITADSYPVHWAQAQCYACIIALEQGLERMGVQLTYVQVESGEQVRFVHEWTVQELEAMVQDMVQAYAPYARMQQRHLLERGESIRALAFPFASYRAGQRRFAGAVYKAVADGRKLFAKAPTGTGKTISTLFPAVKAVGEGLLQRIFYLTAKTPTRTAAEEALARLAAGGLRLKSVTLTAKDKVCFKEETRCDPAYCEFADGYYDRINEALMDLLTHETRMDRLVIEQYARKHRVCPFEFALDAAYSADAVICDYNYIFDPRVSLKRLWEEQKRQTVLLIDEAHNLVDRAREMYSAAVDKAPYLALRRSCREQAPALAAAAKAVNDALLALRKAHDGRRSVVLQEQPPELPALLEAFAAQAERELMGAGPGEGQEELLDTYFAAQAYLRTAKVYDERFVTHLEISGSEVRVKLYCLDPSHLLQGMAKGYRAQVFFSATLSPLPYHMDLLGGGEEDYAVSIPSPFEPRQLEVFIRPLSTRFRDREASYVPIAELICSFRAEHPGNYLVFFPSYEYMREVQEVYSRLAEQETAAGPEPGRLLVQEGGMAEEERERFLAAFQADGRSVTGFAVLGGIFSEGIDLQGERLTGVIIVGVGLPQLSPERDILKEYFARTGRSGYDYAYVYPGMNKVLQAGGRLIRTETDQGTLVLVDDRYLQRSYQSLLPPEWRHYQVMGQR